LANRYYEGPRSDHFDGERFFHPGLASSDKRFWEVVRWRLKGKRVPWPRMVPARSGVQPSASTENLRLTFIGHASLLIQVARINLLIDPVWAERASPFTWIGPRRRNPPAVALEALPPINAVLITHNHYDHLDIATIKKLWSVHRPFVLAPLGNDAIIHAVDPDVEVRTGDWWDGVPLSTAVRVTIVPAYHWSSRKLADRRMALWGGFILETPVGVVYCAGDTAYRDGAIFAEIGRRFGPPLVAVLPIGAYAPRWFMQSQHIDPSEAMMIASACGAQHVLGFHWNTFPLTDEPYAEPAALLAAAAQANGSAGIQAQALRPGDVWEAVRQEG
jgi:L-ascorbate metabolism protein UlaG (beta-lactamase superfamily)